MTFNPLKILRKFRQYKAICKRQCKQLSELNEINAELVAENRRLWQQNRFLQDELKIAQDKARLYELSLDLMQQKKGK